MKNISKHFNEIKSAEEVQDLEGFGWKFFLTIVSGEVPRDERTKLGYDKDSCIFCTNGEKIHNILATIKPWPELLDLLKEHLKRIPENNTSKSVPVAMSADGQTLSLQSLEKVETKEEHKKDNAKAASKIGAGAGTS